MNNFYNKFKLTRYVINGIQSKNSHTYKCKTLQKTPEWGSKKINPPVIDATIP